ncbi:Flagellar protein FliS [Poriferisphaera corsica]|uniref:Flagellar protein FliS n=1 Tax=Poriferisphaera corsica TaxID=2528020 RepID=A0A517YSU0_9BACT|nr:flagellar export chaperone FliS [Poriferisphaera corsica]QDU33303.1 Flagellar protein FliS [Poriferisphaera corsica]
MNQTGQNPYLRTKILTASPHELRLLLFDGAIRFCNQAKKAIDEKDFDTSYHSIMKAEKIILELSSSLNHDVNPDVTEKMVALYNYMYRRLIDANMSRDLETIDEVIKLLQYERETWQMLVNKVQSGAKPAAAPKQAMGGYGQMTSAQQTAISSYSHSA